MPDLKKADRIGGVLRMPFPVSAEELGEPHLHFVTWLGAYGAYTPQVRGDLALVLEVVERGLAGPEHAAIVAGRQGKG